MSDNLIVSPSTLLFSVPVKRNVFQSAMVVDQESDCGCCKTPDSFSNIISPSPAPPSKVIALLAEKVVNARSLKFLTLGPPYAKPFLTSTSRTV